MPTIRLSTDEIERLVRDGMITLGPRVKLPDEPVSEQYGRIAEKDFQADVVRFAKRQGWRVHYTTISKRSPAGWPDLVAVRRGKMVIAELKVGSNKTTSEQDDWIADLRACGIDVRVWRPSDWQEIMEMLT